MTIESRISINELNGKKVGISSSDPPVELKVRNHNIYSDSLVVLEIGLGLLNMETIHISVSKRELIAAIESIARVPK